MCSLYICKHSLICQYSRWKYNWQLHVRFCKFDSLFCYCQFFIISWITCPYLKLIKYVMLKYTTCHMTMSKLLWSRLGLGLYCVSTNEHSKRKNEQVFYKTDNLNRYEIKSPVMCNLRVKLSKQWTTVQMTHGFLTFVITVKILCSSNRT